MKIPDGAFDKMMTGVTVTSGPLDTPCWILQSGWRDDGYTKVGFKGQKWRGHRLSYEVAVGPIPAGLELDHLCRVRACVNPAHLEAVTDQENSRRRDEANGTGPYLTHCKHGHEFTTENTQIRADGRRSCRACRVIRHLQWSAKRRSTTSPIQDRPQDRGSQGSVLTRTPLASSPLAGSTTDDWTPPHGIPRP